MTAVLKNKFNICLYLLLFLLFFFTFPIEINNQNGFQEDINVTPTITISRINYLATV